MGKLPIKGKTTDRLFVTIRYTGRNGIQRKAPALIDTGAYVTYMGIDYIKALGRTVDLSKIKLTQLRHMYSITDAPPTTKQKLPKPKPDEKIYAAVSFKLKNMIFDDIEIPSPIVRVPVSFCYDTNKKEIRKIKFEREDLFLIGTDILRNFNYSVNIDSILFFALSNTTATIPVRKNIDIPYWDFEE